MERREHQTTSVTFNGVLGVILLRGAANCDFVPPGTREMSWQSSGCVRAEVPEDAGSRIAFKMWTRAIVFSRARKSPGQMCALLDQLESILESL